MQFLTHLNGYFTDYKIISAILVKPTTARPHVKPSINAPQVMEVTYGTPVTLTCNATGFPEPSITWHVKHVSFYKDSIIFFHSGKDLESCAFLLPRLAKSTRDLREYVDTYWLINSIWIKLLLKF